MSKRPSVKTLARLSQTDQDEAFFAEHMDRLYRIREPVRSDRAIGETEFEFEFRSLGSHDRARRRVLVHHFARVNPILALARGVRLMRIPFLLFADETVEDRDDVLGPIFHEIMRGAA